MNRTMYVFATRINTRHCQIGANYFSHFSCLGCYGTSLSHCCRLKWCWSSAFEFYWFVVLLAVIPHLLFVSLSLILITEHCDPNLYFSTKEYLVPRQFVTCNLQLICNCLKYKVIQIWNFNKRSVGVWRLNTCYQQ